jgi:hypothetical protein
MLEDCVEQGGREAPGDEATHDRLREGKDPIGEAHRASTAHQNHGGAHRAEKERRRNAGQVEQGDERSSDGQEERHTNFDRGYPICMSPPPTRRSASGELASRSCALDGYPERSRRARGRHRFPAA